jgi:ATP-dependent helicase/nuclease subunit B
LRHEGSEYVALTIVTGLANTGKTGRVHDRVREAAASGLAPILLLPSEPEVRRARVELSRAAPLGISVVQFDRYLDSLWAVVGDGRSIVGQVQRTLVLQRALEASPPEALARSARYPGFIHMLESVARRAGERRTAGGRRAAFAKAGSHAAEILRVLDAYEALLLEGGLVETAEAHRLVVEGLETCHISGPISVNRFGSFTPDQQAFLARCAVLEVELTVALTWADGHLATAAADETVAYLKALPGAIIVEAGDRPEGSRELAHIGEHLFSDAVPPSTFKPEGDVVFSEAVGMGGEAQRIIRDVQEMVESGIPVDTIAVVFRQPESHLAVITAAFAEAGIPLDVDARIQLVRTGLGRALALLLESLCGDGGRAEITGLLRSGYAWAEPDEVDRFDERARLGRVADARRLLDDAKSTGPKTRLLLERAVDLCGSSVDAAHIPAWRWLVADMMRSRHGSGVLLDSESCSDASAQGALMTAIEAMASSGGFGPRNLRALLDSVDVSLSTGEREGHVQLMSAERARSRRFDVVILGGLVAGEFPSRAAEDALGRPDIAAEMARAGIDTSPRSTASAERMLFYQVATGARTRLILSRPIADDEGKPLRASVLWEEMLDLYRDPLTGDVPTVGGPRMRRLSPADLTEHEDAPLSVRRSMRAEAAGESADSPRAVLARRRARARTGAVTGSVAADLAQQSVFSATDIEAYLACPYRWFYERELGPKALEEPVDALKQGQVAHEIMRTFYEDWSREGYERVTADLLGAALEVFSRVAAKVLAGHSDPRTLLEEEAFRGAVSGARRVVERDAAFLPGFVPRHHEWSFGSKGDSVEQIGSFFLKGRIDRIDVSPAGIVIVDYKAGGVTPRAKFRDEGRVQLPLYGLVASRRLDQPLQGGLYRSMRYGGDRGFYSDTLDGVGLVSRDACTEEEFDQVVSEAIAAAETAVAGMRAGEIPATPRATRSCEYCVARSVCGGRVG